MRTTLAIAAAALIVLPATADAGGFARTWHAPAGKHARSFDAVATSYAAFTVKLTVRHGRSFRLTLRNASGSFRAQLIDTRTYACTRSGAWDVCEAAYEALPAGSYTFRLSKPRHSRASTARLAVGW